MNDAANSHVFVCFRARWSGTFCVSITNMNSSSYMTQLYYFFRNAISTRNLCRLAGILGDEEYSRKARSTVDSFQTALKRFPFAMPAFVYGLLLTATGIKEVRVLSFPMQFLLHNIQIPFFLDRSCWCGRERQGIRRGRIRCLPSKQGCYPCKATECWSFHCWQERCDQGYMRTCENRSRSVYLRKFQLRSTYIRHRYSQEQIGLDYGLPLFVYSFM